LLHPIPQDGPHVVSTLLFLRMCLYFLLSYWRLCMCCCIPSHRMAPTWCPRSCSSECVSTSCSLIGVCVCVVASHPTGWPPRGVHALVPQTVSLFLALLLAFVCVCVCVVASHPTGWPPTWCPPLQFLKCASVSRSLLMDVCVFALLHPTSYGRVRVCAVASHFLWTCVCVCAVAPHFLWTCVCMFALLPPTLYGRVRVCVLAQLPPTSYGRVHVCAVASHFLWTCVCLCCCLPLLIHVCVLALLPPTSYGRVRVCAVVSHFSGLPRTWYSPSCSWTPSPSLRRRSACKPSRALCTTARQVCMS